MSNIFIDKALKVIPSNLFPPIVRVVEKSRIQLKDTARVGDDRMKYLFKIYNKYLAGSREQDIKCKGCRAYVWGKMLMLSNAIVEQGLYTVEVVVD